MEAILASQRPASDVSGLGFSENKIDKLLNTCNNNVSKCNRSIVFVKSTKVDEINISKHNSNHTGLGYVPKKRKSVELRIY